jgi:DNA helicase-2/ATP-dependent DNA helicase PcrA
MDEEKTHIILGPPGTGKTTALLEIISNLLEHDASPADIAFVAFTRKAANEARERALVKFAFHDEQVPWFRTLHSMAFKQLGGNRDRMMGMRDFLNICELLGLSITFKGISEDGTFAGLTKGDRLFFMENMSRARMMPLKDYWEQFPNEDIYWHELERLHNTLVEYKRVNQKSDYTDLIYNFLESGIAPSVRYLIVDEAQDLSPLQWKMIDKLSQDVQEVYVAGDDDQAIFRWAGADIEGFQNLRGTRRVLDQSYRCPIKVFELADEIICRIKTRIVKPYKSTLEEGVVEHVTQLDQIDMREGTWLLLARNAYLLNAYNEHCIRMGYVFTSSIGSPIQGASLVAIRTWESLRKGNSETAAHIRKIYDLMTTKVGVAYGSKSRLDKVPDNQPIDLEGLRQSYGLLTDAIWHQALDKLPIMEREYFLAALRSGEKLLKEPRIRINTIHGVKGGEADHVVVQTDMAGRTFAEFQENPDDEHRVWYVALTRARKSLHILQPQTNWCYDI